MAKVNATNDKKLPGKPGKSLTALGNAKSNEVVAVRNGNERTFPRAIWDHLPPGKDGFEEVSENFKPAATSKPGDTSESKGGVDSGKKLTAKDQKDAYKAAADNYKIIFGEAVAPELTTEEINDLISKKQASESKGGADNGGTE